MKKCPKCKAEIEEEARFCLYCMTSFEEKQTIETPKENNNRWLIIIAAVFVFVFISVGIFLSLKNKSPKNEKINTSSAISTGSNSDIYDYDNSTALEQQKNEPQGGETSNFTSGSETSTPSKTASVTNSNNSTTSSTSQNSGTNSSINSTPANPTSSDDKTESGSSDNGSSTPEESAPLQTETVIYDYRSAKYGDDFSAGANLENAVVITGVKTSAADGKYIIPETLDGKKVVAIMALAFCDAEISATVKTVIVPSSVKTIWNNAFANCYNLTDIYFKGNAIYTESNAFPEKSKRNGTLTIHCSANCSDRNYRYYKNSASNYDAEYKEWNG